MPGQRNLSQQKVPGVYVVRGVPVVLDKDIAEFFGVGTKALNQQVKRNAARFGGDFAFRLTPDEYASLRSQFVTSNVGSGWGGSRYLPNVFTEHGVVMSATILNSERAAVASRMIVKAFVEARKASASETKSANLPATVHPSLLTPLAADARHGLMGKLNAAIGNVLDAIADPQRQTSVKDEAREIAAEGLKSLKEYLKRSGVQNEKTLAEVRKIMAEAESIEVETDGKRAANEAKQFVLLAKKLRLVLEAQRFVETGDMQSLMRTLDAFDQP